ncbi:cadherin-23-like [Physella acuta]|uniref:cadherin-23-like n=1 Tax=Physella acuta TaxID=109671 RepID=UPI0027DCCC5F|nr:cadherin-23-like [Physella acuta]
MGPGCLCLIALYAGLSHIVQGQNQPPTWDVSSISVFPQGFSEATPLGTPLANLKCNDPEGDPITYILRLGNNVRVFANGTCVLSGKLDFEAKDPLGYDLTFACVDVNNVGQYLHEWVEIRTQISVNDANDNPPKFETDSVEGYSFYISEDAPVRTMLKPSIRIRDLDRTVNARLDKLYIICNSPFPSELSNLTQSSEETCKKFMLNYTQEDEGLYTASLTLIDKLDYETRPVYSSKLVAIDAPGVTPQFTTTVNVQINVIDAQDVNPIFINPGTSTSISEGAPVGTTLGSLTIAARDGDFGDKRPVDLTFLTENPVFNLSQVVPSNTTDGVYQTFLIVRSQLDRERTATYDISILATELDKTSLNRTNATAIGNYSVFVTDINDNPPRFNQTQYSINVTELEGGSSSIQIANLHIICSDPDASPNNQYTISIVNQTFPAAYSVSPDTTFSDLSPNNQYTISIVNQTFPAAYSSPNNQYTISIVNQTFPAAYSVSPDTTFSGLANVFLKIDKPEYLDYDNPLYREQTVVLVARETNTPERYSGSTTISLHVTDVNDNSPVFKEGLYTLNVSENVSSYQFPAITATDRDSGDNKLITYSLSGATSNLFSINNETGVVSLRGALDYETNTQYVFLVSATDHGSPPRSSQTQLVIYVLNVNDVAPVFSPPSYQTSVTESSLTFLNPVVVYASDNEVGTNITYRILSGDPNQSFAVNALTGEVTLVKNLTFEDTPVTSTGSHTGVYTVVIEASDNGQPPLKATAQVRVSIIDENNHSPVFQVTNINKELSELAPAGTLVAKLNATDADSGDFGKITYRIGAGQSDSFFVNETTGTVTVNSNNSFDYNVKNNYILIIYATDGGVPQKTATATITVTILDANNKNPTFGMLIYSREVDEKTPINTVTETPINTEVLTVPATDLDTNALLSYYISDVTAFDRNGNQLTSTIPYNYKDAFGVRSNGTIFVKGSLDKSLAQEIRFQLVVRDNNTQFGTGIGTTQISLSITGVAESTIKFDPFSQVFMNEDAELGYQVITLTARDPSNIPVDNYTRLSGSPSFDIHPSIGRVTLIQKIDYENDAEPDHLHQLIVRATNKNNTAMATATVTISIVDVNDNNPVFQYPLYDVSVPESFTYPMEVVSIYATDADSKSYGPLEFTFSGGLDADDFTIFHEEIPSGALTSRRAHILVAAGKALDYNRRDSYDLTLLVGDNLDLKFSNTRLYGTAQLRIKVVDENNNSPIFKELARNISIPETADVGTSVAAAIATDADRGRNGEITYSLEPDSAVNISTDTTLFSVLPSLGTIYVARPLLGLGGNKYYLQVRARDGGDVPNSSLMKLVINILSTEDNDGNPKWLQPDSGFVLYAPEETPGYVLNIQNVTTFLKVDSRHGSTISYFLSPYGPYMNNFKINSSTGEITITGRLDREVQDTYQLLVYAEDHYNNSVFQSGRQFLVQLWDLNDNQATFTNPKKYAGCQVIDRPLVIKVEENTAANVTIYILKACDADAPPNNGILYSLYNDNLYCSDNNNKSALRLEPDGRLVTQRIIDYEQDKEFLMCVRASSSVLPTFQGRKKREFDLTKVNTTLDNVAYISVQVSDQNDNGPNFPQGQVEAVIQTDPKSGPVLFLDAVDPDGAGNNLILYRIESSAFYPQNGAAVPILGAFTIRGDKGALYPSLPSYQAYSEGHFVLTIVATDASNKFSARQTIKIYVHEKGEALKLILNLQPDTGFNQAQTLVSKLNQISSNYLFSYLQVSEHRTLNGFDSSKTDVCFLAVDTQTDTILNIREVASLLDKSQYSNVLQQTQFRAFDRGQCYPSQSSEQNVKWRDLWWVLVALAIFIFLCCLILIVLVCILYSRYKRYMETRKTYMMAQ